MTSTEELVAGVNPGPVQRFVTLTPPPGRTIRRVVAWRPGEN